MNVKPADPTAIIRDPHTKRALPSSGAVVPESLFWIRRLRDGDVVIVVDDVSRATTMLSPDEQGR